MPKRTNIVIAALAAFLLLPIAMPGLAFAHERRTIANGKYDVVVGWDVEPAFEGQKNAASIRIMKAGTEEPVSGVENTLKVQIRQGGTTGEFALRTVFNRPGYYVANIVPTRAGDYQWIFTGTIEGNQVNETFDTADKKFNAVEPIAALQFPVALQNPAEMADRIAAMEGVVQDSAQLTARITGVEAEASAARTLGYVGTAAGFVGLLAGLGAWLGRPRARAAAPAAQASRQP